MGLASTFPIVRHNGRLIQDSSTIITYLDDRFTRADLTAASLLAPLHKLPQYGMVWPELPAELETLIASWASQTQWLLPLYQAHR